MNTRRRPLAHGVAAALFLIAYCLIDAAPIRAQDTALSGQEIRELIVGNTLIGPINARQYDFSYEPDGNVYGDIGVSTDRGTWEISDDGVYCHEWTLHFDSTRRCYKWFRAKRQGRYVMKNIDKFRVRDIDVWRIKPGLQ